MKPNKRIREERLMAADADGTVQETNYTAKNAPKERSKIWPNHLRVKWGEGMRGVDRGGRKPN